jgi:hypothetical protein
MADGRWRDHLSNPREFNKWLKANAVVGSVLPIALLAMALAGLYSAGSPNGATEFSSVNAASCQTTQRHAPIEISTNLRTWRVVCGRMVRLSDSELAQLFEAATPLPLTAREEFLAEVAKALEGKDLADGELQHLLRDVQRRYPPLARYLTRAACGSCVGYINALIETEGDHFRSSLQLLRITSALLSGALV